MEKQKNIINQNQDLESSTFEEIFLDTNNAIKENNKVIENNSIDDKCNVNTKNLSSNYNSSIDSIEKVLNYNIKLNVNNKKNNKETSQNKNTVTNSLDISINDNQKIDAVDSQNEKNKIILNDDKNLVENDAQLNIKEELKILPTNNFVVKTEEINKYGGIYVEINENSNPNIQNNFSNKLNKINIKNNNSDNEKNSFIEGMDPLTGNFIKDVDSNKQVNNIIDKSKKTSQLDCNQNNSKLPISEQTINSFESRSFKRGV